MTRAISTPETRLRTVLAATENALAEALALNAELQEQLDRANRAAVRMGLRDCLVVIHEARRARRAA